MRNWNFLFFDSVFDAAFEGAVEFMKEEFYSLNAKVRFRAFIVVRLTDLMRWKVSRKS